MTIEIYSLGGYEEVGKNMTAVKVDDEIILLDMGIHLDPLMALEEKGLKPEEPNLTNEGVLPDDKPIQKMKDNVKAIVISHAHLDHCGAVEYMAKRYDAPVIGTPFTMEFLRNSMPHKKFNRINTVTMEAGEKVDVGKTEVEFVHLTHSTPQTVHTALHTPEGIVYYASDFKFDNSQALTKPPDYKRMKKLGKEGVEVAIVESVGSEEYNKTPGEVIAREMLKDTLTTTINDTNGILVTSFSSHIERLNSIQEAAKKLDRKVSFCGRSLAKYIKVAEAVGIKKFPNLDVMGRQKAMKKVFKKAAKNKQDHLIVVTGGQGEPRAILSRIVNGDYSYKIEREDQVIFSCRTIPTPINIQNRHKLEENIISQGGRVFRDVHVSGHADREDHRDLIKRLNPKNLIPCHGDIQKLAAYADLASEEYNQNTGENYKLGDNIHLLRNGQKKIFNN
ncbi:MAG: RNase J family beta-CASP ribonuclease [Candidatus Undinarchaeales archaeon]